MKKFLVVLSVAFSNVGFGQLTDNDVNDIVTSIASWENGTHSFKTGDHDMPQVKGLVQYLFDDLTILEQLVKINSRIGELQVEGFSYGDTISFSKWANTLDDTEYDPKLFNREYTFEQWATSNTGELLFRETLTIRNKETGERARTVIIYYNSDNLRAITDSNIH
jgi:hypothetical protein